MMERRRLTSFLNSREPSIALLAMLSLLLGAQTSASPIRPESIPEDAVWYAHLDVEEALASALGTLARNPTRDRDESRIRVFARVFGFSLLDDLRGITAYGLPGGDARAVLAIDADFDKEYLIDLVRITDTYDRFEYGGRTVHQWANEDADQEYFGAFADAGTLLLANSEDLVRSALDTLDGRAQGLSELSTRDGQTPGVPPLLIGTADLERMDRDGQSRVVRAIANGDFSTAVEDGELRASLWLHATSETGAVRVHQTIDGLLALTAWARDRPGLVRLADAVRTRRIDSQVEALLSFPVLEFVNIVQGWR